jgi:hypothetical protein
MTTALPGKIPLDMPLGDPEAIDDVVRSVAGAAHVLAVLAGDLEGPAATAPGWLGDDAAAAAAQIGRVRDLVREVGGAVLIATGHLSAHADRLREARRQVRDLEAEQDDDHAAAWSRWSELEVLRAQVQYDGAGAVAVVEELRASEESRRRRHAALLAEVEDDAAATARALVDACAVVGGTGRPGDDARALAHLAVLLPGWGEEALRDRAQALASDLDSFLTPEDREDLVRQALPYAANEDFALAFLSALGTRGMAEVLGYLGEGIVGPESAQARLMATVLAAAGRVGDVRADAAEVLDAIYVDAIDPDATYDFAALGMAVVLAASVSLGPQGISPRTVSAWGQQIVQRDRMLGRTALERVNQLSEDAEPVDAVPIVVDLLARSQDKAAAAALLATPGAWDVLLTRAYDDCGLALGRLVEQATGEGVDSGSAAVRAGLEALGAGLEDNHPDGWTVNRATANAVTDALARGVGAHVDVVAEALRSLGEPTTATEDLLNGLGYLTIGRDPALVVGKALAEWAAAAAPVTDEELFGWTGRLPSFTVPAAYLAVQEYGQRLAHALHGYEQQAIAERRALTWDWTLGLITTLLPDPVDMPVQIIVDYLAIGLGFDGRWSNGEDHGLTFGQDEAVTSAIANLPADQRDSLDRIVFKAREAYELTVNVMGSPKPPEPPGVSWWRPAFDALMPGPDDLLRARAARLSSPVR